MIKKQDIIAQVLDIWNPCSAGDSWTSASESLVCEEIVKAVKLIDLVFPLLFRYD